MRRNRNDPFDLVAPFLVVGRIFWRQIPTSLGRHFVFCPLCRALEACEASVTDAQDAEGVQVVHCQRCGLIRGVNQESVHRLKADAERNSEAEMGREALEAKGELRSIGRVEIMSDMLKALKNMESHLPDPLRWATVLCFLGVVAALVIAAWIYVQGQEPGSIAISAFIAGAACLAGAIVNLLTSGARKWPRLYRMAARAIAGVKPSREELQRAVIMSGVRVRAGRILRMMGVPA